MSNRKHTDIDDLFAGFNDVTPDADTCLQAVERTRQALIAQADQSVSLPQSQWKTQMNRRSFKAAALALLALAAALPMLYQSDGGSAFAQLQDHLKKVRTISFKTTLTMHGKPAESMTQRIRNDGSLREDREDGSYRIVKRTEDSITRIHVDPVNKTARVTHGFAGEEREDVIGMILNVPKSQGATPIDARDIDGRSCPGFVIKRELGKDRWQEIRIWIDPDTKWPAYSENVAEWKQATEDASGPSRAIAKSSNFKYDVAIEDSVFDLTPPEGYAVTTIGTPVAERTAPWPAEKLVLVVGEAIGPAKFGMSRDEVLTLLGEPDDKMKSTPKVREGFPQPELETWHYFSQGFNLTFSSFEDPRLSSVCCRDSYNDVTRDFQGKTKEGIGLGASTDEVQRAYGRPNDNSVENGLGGFVYHDKRLRFGFVEGKVVQIRISRVPKEKSKREGR